MINEDKEKKELINLRLFTLLIITILFSSVYIVHKYGKGTPSNYKMGRLNGR